LALWKAALTVAFVLPAVSGSAHRGSDQTGLRGVIQGDDARTSVDTMAHWLTQNADPRQPRETDQYLRTTAEYALKARNEIKVAGEVPEDIFLEFVLPYRLVDEPVDNFRKSFYDVLAPSAKKAENLTSAVKDIVPRIFTELRASKEVMRDKANDTAVVFKSNQTPAVMAPISETLLAGYASCTGTSILIVDALRSVGIPARVVGTPEWNIPTKGNHNWVEVWTGEGEDGWHFFDASEHNPVSLDKGWFFPGNTQHASKDDPMHKIYTATWSEDATDSEYPLTWRTPFVNWRAKDRTDFYLAASNSATATTA